MNIPEEQVDELLNKIDAAKSYIAKGDYPHLDSQALAALDHLHMWALGMQALARLTNLPDREVAGEGDASQAQA